MSRFTNEQLRDRAFFRAAWVLYNYWEEQRDDPNGYARVHSRLFDPLVPDIHIRIGQSSSGGGYREHVVPCVVIRDLAFKMYRERANEDGDSSAAIEDVARMIGRLLRIAYITEEDARIINRKYRTSMPDGWDFEADPITARLDEFGIILVAKT